MSAFSPTEAAFSGFTFLRREWRAVMIWAALRLVVSLALTGAFILVAGDDLARVAEAGAGAPEQLADPTELLALVRGLEPVGLLAWLVGFVLQSLLISAFYRASLRPEEGGFAFLRLGRAELVIAAVTVLWWLLYFAGLFVLIFAALLAAMVASQLAPQLAAVVATLALLGFLVAMVWALIRSSLAWVDSFDRKTVSLFHSLKLTRGHFWSLFGAYALAFALTVVVSLMALAVFMILAAVAALATGQGLASVAAVFDANPASLAGAFSVAMFLWLLFSAVTGACSYPLLLGPTAEAYKAFKAQGEAPAPAPAFREEGEGAAPA